jgi:hypothetical protein
VQPCPLNKELTSVNTHHTTPPPMEKELFSAKNVTENVQLDWQPKEVKTLYFVSDTEEMK